MAAYIIGKGIHINFDYCYKYTTIDGKVIWTIENTLTCHARDEADTKMIFHICELNFGANVKIPCSDTDVLIIMLANTRKINTNMDVCMEVGNHQRFINI